MGSGRSPVGEIPAVVIDHGHGEFHTDAKLGVVCWWTSAESGVELVSDDLGARIGMDDDDAFKLVELVLHAIQPGRIPDNGYERWVERVRQVAESVIAQAYRSPDD